MRFGPGLWRLADPKISLASIASWFLGACAAGAAGPLHAGWLALTLAALLALETAKNASGEIFDFDSGADLAVAPEDRSPFSGGKRVLVDELLTRAETWRIALAGYAIAGAIGAGIAVLRDARVLWLGLPGAGLAFFYHAPPPRLSYRGGGELAVALCYGPGIAAGTYLVQRQHWDGEVAWAAAPLGLLIAGFLWVNEFPDYKADLGAGKRNLVVRLGRRRAAVAYAALVATAFAVLALAPAIGGVSRGAWLGFAAALPAADSVRRLLAAPETTARIVGAQKSALLAFLGYALLSGIGVAAGGPR